LVEEIAVCILGGFGLPFELGLAAFCAVRNELLRVTSTPSAANIEAVLSEPLLVGSASRRYRFPRQRAQRLAAALTFVNGADLDDMTAVELRDWLLDAPGIGPKTASWIVRNQRATDEVAVLDVHVMRAGVRAGVFPEDATVQRHYLALEELFLGWAAEGDVSAADLDAVIWAEEAYWARHRDARL
jgi:thermostable 8-oxoguanine DNA glycosylase